MAWIPKNEYITPGIWNITLEAEQVINGEINMWLPVYGSTSSEVTFLRPSRSDTLVIPSTARSSISVSAYNSINDTLAPFSGAGRVENEIRNSKPDLAAPGVQILSARVGGGYGYFTGTSFAVPFVTAASALLMQWGIVNGNDPYMFGEKVRANLIRGARRLPFQEQLPSPEVGWGALCVSDSIPKS